MARGNEIDWDWLQRNQDDIQTYTLQHLRIVAIAVGVAVVIAIPIAVAVRRSRVAYAGALVTSDLLYTIPSLALFAILVPVLGIGDMPVLIGLVAYSMLVLIRNTVVGLRSVPRAVHEAATGMGLTRRQVLFKVELPLALPSIVAGMRVAAVSAVGIATIGVFVGAGGLGELIYNDGINRSSPFLTAVLAGAVIAFVMALLIDLLLLGLERLLKPWARAGRRA
ncbi:MAG: ABC transporter permease [Thermoleophilia bacterium]|jgi:osmoprotectant transport system permease protein|nr:ABC transporter permease [Thermoleophilia bacterium]